MYFGLSEEQSFFQDNVRKYLEEHATIDNIKHIASGDEKNLSAEINQGLHNLGINGLLIPEEFGGLGLDLLFAAAVSEALGGGVGPIPFIAPYVIAPTAIKHAGSKTQQENYLSKIATNEYCFGVGFTLFRLFALLIMISGRISLPKIFLIFGCNTPIDIPVTPGISLSIFSSTFR